MANDEKKARARAIANGSGWTVAALEDAGLHKLEVLRGADVAADVIASKDRVLLCQLGGDYLIGWLI